MNEKKLTQIAPTPRPTPTDFQKDMTTGRKFWLGPIARSHEIGDYQFIEYQELIFHPKPNAGELSGKNGFSAFIGGRHIGRSYNSLDAALVGVVAYRRDGCNTRADTYFMKATEPAPSVVSGNEKRLAAPIIP